MTSLSIPDAALELFYNHFEDMFTNAMYFPYQAACLASNQGDFDICEEQFQTTANYYKEWCNELIKGLTTIVNDEEKAELSKSTPPPPPPKVQPKKIFGYWEDWSKSVNTSGNDDLPAYYKTDVTPYTHVAYAFLTLAARPNPENPQPCKWGGKILYENMTATDVTIVMKNQKPAWKNQFNWQREKIQAVMDETHANGSKFVWSIGGWSDCTETLDDADIDAFATQVIKLLTIGAGDGIDLDWEHLSSDMKIRDTQTKTIAHVFQKLRKALDDAKFEHVELGWTTRWNAFYDDKTRPKGYKVYNSDGEGILIEAELQKNGSTLKKVINWANIMLYDCSPNDLAAPTGLTLDNYKTVFEYFEKFVNPEQIVMGFEPGGQSTPDSKWEGIEVDKNVIKYIAGQKYGGVQFWAMNQKPYNGSKEVTGKNALELATLAKSLF